MPKPLRADTTCTSAMEKSVRSSTEERKEDVTDVSVHEPFPFTRQSDNIINNNNNNIIIKLKYPIGDMMDVMIYYYIHYDYISTASCILLFNSFFFKNI